MPLRVVVAATLSTALLSGCLAIPWPTSERTPSPAPAPDELLVEYVIDGDTVIARDAAGADVHVRLLGIDTPEIAHDDVAEECGGVQARDHLRTLVEERVVRSAVDPGTDEHDRFGRLLRYLATDEQEDVALAMVRAGLAVAWHPASEPEPGRFAAYDRAEDEARSAGVGLWAQCGQLGR